MRTKFAVLVALGLVTMNKAIKLGHEINTQENANEMATSEMAASGEEMAATGGEMAATGGDTMVETMMEDNMAAAASSSSGSSNCDCECGQEHEAGCCGGNNVKIDLKFAVNVVGKESAEASAAAGTTEDQGTDSA